MNKVLTIFFLSLCFLTGFSQNKDLLKGFIVVKSDTIYGFLESQNFETTPSSINFRKTENDAYQSYRAADISSFSVFGILFQTIQVTIDVSSTKLDDIINKTNIKVVADTTLFLRTRFDSEQIKLYEHRRNDKIHYFLQKEFKRPEELVKKCSVIGTAITCQSTYWRILRVYMNDCPSITDNDIENTELSFSDLKRLLVKYVKCKSGKVNELTETSDGKVHSLVTSFYAAPGLTFLTFNGPYGGLANAKFGSSFSIQAGVSFDDISKLNPKLILGADIGIRYYSAKSEQTFINPYNGGNDHVTYTIAPTYVKISPSLRYVFVSSSLQPYVRVGVSVNYAVSFSSNYDITESGNLVTPHTTSDAIMPDQLNKTELSYFLGAGVKKNNFSVELRGERGNGMLQNFVYYSSNSITSSLYIIYRLSKS